MVSDIPEIYPEIPVPPPEKKLFWGGWPTAGFGALILLVLFLLMVIVMGILAFALAIGQADAAFSLDDFSDTIYSYMGLLVSTSGIIAYGASAGLILVFVKIRDGARIGEYLGLKRISWKVVLVALLVTVAFLAASYMFDYLFHIEESDTNTLVDIYDTSVWPILLWITVVVFAPLFEEGLFRGFLFEGFRRSRMGLVVTILVTSFVWTCLHAGYSVSSLGAIFVFGLVLGFVRHKTGSLWTTIFMHAVYNAVGMVFIALGSGV